jgi:hypothetical protein
MTDALRPMTLGELLDRTFFLYRKHFILFVGLIALPHLALLAVQLAAVVLGQQRVLTFSLTTIVMTLITMLVYLAVLAVSQGATVIAVSRLHLGREASISDAFASLEGRIVTISLLMVRVGLNIAVGLILLIVPGVLVALKWSLAIPVTVLEHTGMSASLSRSSVLTKGYRLRILAIYFLFVVLTYIFYSLWEIPLLVAGGLFSRRDLTAGVPAWTEIAFPVGGFLTQSLVGPLLTIALSLAYYDQRVRKEAFDLEHMMSLLDEKTT